MGYLRDYRLEGNAEEGFQIWYNDILRNNLRLLKPWVELHQS